MEYAYKDMRLSYEIIGSGQSVLLIHGLGCDHRLMKGCMEPVFKHLEGYRRIYVDLPGMGHSYANPNTICADRIVEALSAFITYISKGSFLLIGESYGGYLARGVLAQVYEHVEGMFLLCPVIYPQHALRTLPKKGYTQMDEAFVSTLDEQQRHHFCEHIVVVNATTYARYQKEVVSGCELANRECIEQLEKHYACSWDVDRKLKERQFTKPTLFLCGHQDTCVGYQDAFTLLTSYPRASFVVIDAAGHHAQIDQPNLMEIHMRDWLRRIRQEAIA